MELLHAGFKIYLISELSKVGDGSLTPSAGVWTARDFKGYVFDGEPTAKVDGATTGEIFTDSKGRLTSPEIPYGTYVIAETRVPAGRMAVNPVIVTVMADRREPQPWRLFNDEEIKFFIKVIKRDSDTGENVLDKTVAYRIFDLDKNEYVTMKTTYPKTVYHGTEENPFRVSTSGALVTPQKLGYGRFRIDEVEAPTGYVKVGYEGILRPGYEKDGEYDPAPPSTPIIIDMDSQTPIYDEGADEDVLEFVQYNEPQKGKLSVKKTGDVFKGMRRTEKNESVFLFRNKNLAGVEFDVIARSDILTQDGHGTVIATAGAVIETIVTNRKGEAATTAPLPIGGYTLRECAAKDGLIPMEGWDFEVTAADQEIAYTYHAKDIDNVRQKLAVEILKVDKKTENPLPGAKFGLYAAADIIIPDSTAHSMATDGAITTGAGVEDDAKSAESEVSTSEGAVTDGAMGQVPYAVDGNIIPAGTLLRTAWSEPDGIATFYNLIPGEYEVRELVAPNGYLLNTSFSAVFTLAYDTESRVESITYSAVCANEKKPKPPAPACLTPPAICTPPAVSSPPAVSTPPAVQPAPPAVRQAPPAVTTPTAVATPAAVSTPSAVSTPKTIEGKEPENRGKGYGVPKTGDGFPLELAGIIAAAAAATLFFITRRYRRMK
jgi:hypothetical protein